MPTAPQPPQRTVLTYLSRRADVTSILTLWRVQEYQEHGLTWAFVGYARGAVLSLGISP
jgi:hypothetical protein